MKKTAYGGKHGFTIVELLIVIVVIAILAVVTIVAYNGITVKAQDSKVRTDLAQLQKAVMMARDNTGKTLLGISGSGYTAQGCANRPAGTDLSLEENTACWSQYRLTLERITDASGVDVRGLKDPWGRPYYIDENEGENGTACGRDRLTVYTNPHNGGSTMSKYETVIPLSGNSGC